ARADGDDELDAPGCLWHAWSIDPRIINVACARRDVPSKDAAEIARMRSAVWIEEGPVFCAHA
ncbi:MAG TPA: hypothetical protein VIX61_05995, partial [Casimicrobiaceae bacterium]